MSRKIVNKIAFHHLKGDKNMDKKLAEIIKREIENKAYVPGDWVGVSEVKEVHLRDVLQIIDKYTEEN